MGNGVGRETYRGAEVQGERRKRTIQVAEEACKSEAGRSTGFNPHTFSSHKQEELRCGKSEEIAQHLLFFFSCTSSMILPCARRRSERGNELCTIF